MLSDGQQDLVCIPAALWSAYESTNYEIDTGEALVSLRVGLPVPALLLAPNPGRKRLTVVTAYKPFSTPISDAESEQGHQHLLRTVVSAGHAVLPAIGRGTSDDWAPETSLAIFDPSDDELDDWMVTFGQNAIVVAERSGAVALRFHPHEATRVARAAGRGAVRN